MRPGLGPLERSGPWVGYFGRLEKPGRATAWGPAPRRPARPNPASA